MIKLVVTDIDGTALRPGQGELEPDFLPLVEKEIGRAPRLNSSHRL